MNRNFTFPIGRMAALFVAIETTIFAFSLVWGLIFHSEFDQILGYIASLFLAVSFVIMIACFYEGTQGPRRIFGLLALVFAILYSLFCIANYFLQLTIAALNPLNFSGEVLKAIVFMPGSPTFALDMLGYGFMCLSTLTAGYALTGTRENTLRILCFINGAIAIPSFASPILSGIFRSTSGQTNDVGSYILLFWCTVFLPIAFLFMKYFKEGNRL